MSGQRQHQSFNPTRTELGEVSEEKFDADTGPNVELHARNLHNPSHMEWTQDGRLLVSEHSAGRVMEITDGGDQLEAEPFAEGLEGPASMAMLDDGRILVVETWAGRVKEISEGGDVSEKEAFAEGLKKPYSIETVKADGEERIYVTEDHLGIENWITDITEGGEPSDADVVMDEFPVTAGAPGNTPLTEAERDGSYEELWEQYASANCSGGWETTTMDGERLFVKGAQLGQVIEVTDMEGQTYYDAVRDGGVVARGLDHVGGIFINSDDGLLYGAEPLKGRVFAVDIDRKGNYRFTPSVVKGLIQPTCLRFGPDGGGDEMFVCGRGEGVIWKVTDWR